MMSGARMTSVHLAELPCSMSDKRQQDAAKATAKVCVCVCACACACVCVCARACVRACVRVRVSRQRCAIVQKYKL